MLITKPLDVGDIATFKLVNGDEIVAEITQTNHSGWSVKRPCTVVPSPQGIGLLQSLFTGNLESIQLDKQHVIMYAKTIDEIVKHYLSTTSGIAVQSNSSGFRL